MAPAGRRLLVVDTATPVAVIGVVDVGADEAAVVVVEAALHETQRHAERLPDAVSDVLAAAGAVDGVVVGVGPGSFIGVRTGIAFVAGLCRARGLPLLGTSTLAALACSVDVDVPDGAGVVAVLDAKRGEHYVQRFVRRGARLEADGPPQAARPGAHGAHDGDVVVGVGGVDAAARVGPSVLGIARAAALGALVTPVLPLYVRAPDAKLPSVDPGRALKDLGGGL